MWRWSLGLMVLLTVGFAQLGWTQKGEEGVILRVRVVNATQVSRSNSLAKAVKASAAETGDPAVVSAELQDISSQLQQLPYNRFSLLAVEEVPVPLRKRQWIKLRDGSNLGLRLLYQEEMKAGISLNWRDRSGNEILNTKMHFDCHSPIVTGTNKGEKGASVLAINVVDK